MNKDLFFLILSLGCVWLILNQLYGSKLITQFVVMIIPDAKKGGEEE